MGECGGSIGSVKIRYDGKRCGWAMPRRSVRGSWRDCWGWFGASGRKCSTPSAASTPQQVAKAQAILSESDLLRAMLDVVYLPPPPHTAGRTNGGKYARLVNIAQTPAGSRSNLSAKMPPLAFLERASFVDHDCPAELPLGNCWNQIRWPAVISTINGSVENLHGFAKIHSRTNWRDHRSHYYFAGALASSRRDATRISGKPPRSRRL
jgi:hypothetical protein